MNQQTLTLQGGYITLDALLKVCQSRQQRRAGQDDGGGWLGDRSAARPVAQDRQDPVLSSVVRVLDKEDPGGGRGRLSLACACQPWWQGLSDDALRSGPRRQAPRMAGLAC